ncbi:hypothetical protein MHBO_000967 [Bonamia ostreae]|uniref:LAGLIDADG homing endonuclease n=1 Tax=Bonamia ostreae TaxID=126728 RepID=A0ABV2AHE5_9EUKA
MSGKDLSHRTIGESTLLALAESLLVPTKSLSAKTECSPSRGKFSFYRLYSKIVKPCHRFNRAQFWAVLRKSPNFPHVVNKIKSDSQNDKIVRLEICK